MYMVSSVYFEHVSTFPFTIYILVHIQIHVHMHIHLHIHIHINMYMHINVHHDNVCAHVNDVEELFVK